MCVIRVIVKDTELAAVVCDQANAAFHQRVDQPLSPSDQPPSASDQPPSASDQPPSASADACVLGSDAAGSGAEAEVDPATKKLRCWGWWGLEVLGSNGG